MRKIILYILLAIVIGCAGAIDIRSIDTGSRDNSSNGTLEDSQDFSNDQIASVEKMITEKCQSCHKPIDPNEYDDDKLRQVIAGHRKRAHLSPDEISQVTDYLIAKKSSDSIKSN